MKVSIQIRRADAGRAWFGLRPFAWLGLGTAVAGAVFMGAAYEGSPAWYLAFAFLLAMLIGFTLRGVVDTNRPLMQARCGECGYLDFESDPRRLRLAMDKHLIRDHQLHRSTGDDE